MKRLLALWLVLSFLPLLGAFSLAEEALPELYVGKMRISGKVFENWEGTEGIKHINTKLLKLCTNLLAFNWID